MGPRGVAWVLPRGVCMSAVWITLRSVPACPCWGGGPGVGGPWIDAPETLRRNHSHAGTQSCWLENLRARPLYTDIVRAAGAVKYPGKIGIYGKMLRSM